LIVAYFSIFCFQLFNSSVFNDVNDDDDDDDEDDDVATMYNAIAINVPPIYPDIPNVSPTNI
jgi:hypothetical protein